METTYLAVDMLYQDFIQEFFLGGGGFFGTEKLI